MSRAEAEGRGEGIANEKPDGVQNSTPGMTLYRQVDVTDDWKVGEVHLSALGHRQWFAQAKLKSGRVPHIFFTQATEQLDEAVILGMLLTQDLRDRVRERLSGIWQFLTRCYCCRCGE